MTEAKTLAVPVCVYHHDRPSIGEYEKLGPLCEKCMGEARVKQQRDATLDMLKSMLNAGVVAGFETKKRLYEARDEVAKLKRLAAATEAQIIEAESRLAAAERDHSENQEFVVDEIWPQFKEHLGRFVREPGRVGP
jgi:hypothetical protein